MMRMVDIGTSFYGTKQYKKLVDFVIKEQLPPFNREKAASSGDTAIIPPLFLQGGDSPLLLPYPAPILL
jgi:hypothetical protein